jgi:putative transposase
MISVICTNRASSMFCRGSSANTEFISRAILHWLKSVDIETAFIVPGKPWQNGTAESLNGKFRDECLNMEWFRSRAEARVIIETWLHHYNEDRGIERHTSSKTKTKNRPPTNQRS